MTTVKHTLHIVLALLLISFGTTLIVPGSVHAQAAQNTECSQGSNTVTIQNNDALVVAPAGQSWGNTSIGPISADIPAGIYTLDYVSFDDHSVDGDLGQDEERWYIEGFYEGSAVFRSAETEDVAAELDYQSGILNSNVAIPQLDSVVIHHVQEVDPSGSLPQSVIPVCVSFSPEPNECDETAGFVADDQGNCVCEGDRVVVGNAGTDGSISCQCPDGSVSSSTNPNTCVVCEGDLLANSSKDVCECPAGTVVSASDDTVCVEEEQSVGVLGASTTNSNKPQDSAPQVLADSDVLAETGTSQTLVIATGSVVAVIALYLTSRRLKYGSIVPKVIHPQK